MEAKLKHLEFIQNVINRMAANSFLLKGWSVTLVSAIFALAAKDADIRYVLITYLVIPIFWALDAFFLSRERQYRNLFNSVAQNTNEISDFDMDAHKHTEKRATFFWSLFSTTLWPFHGILLISTLIVMFILPNFKH